MRQTLSARAPDYESPRQAGTEAVSAPASYESLIAATTASERRAVETAAKTAQALDSVAAWIEQAQSRFAETARVATEAQTRTTSVVNDALGTFGQKLGEIERKVETAAPTSVAETLKRIESRLNLAPAGQDAGEPAGEIKDALRGFEERIASLTERLNTAPRPIGRRGLKAEDEIKTAVAEIRQRQAELDEQPAGPDASVRPIASARASYDRGQSAALTSLRGDIARLASQLETVRPSQAAIDHLNEEFEQLRGAMDGLATRQDLATIERSLADVTGQIAEARSLGRGVTQIAAEIEHLQDSVRRLSETKSAPDMAAFDGRIEELSAKLDALSRNGGDGGLRHAMLGELNDIRAILANIAAPAEMAALASTLSELRDEVAGLAARQVDPREFAELKTNVAGMQQVLAAAPTASGAKLAGADLAQGLRPVETLLHALVDKIDNVERQVIEKRAADPISLDGLERQISDLAARFSQNTGRDPAVAHLESAMSGLMGEIATWREDAFEAAERAARKAVAETLASAPAAPAAAVEREVADLKQRYDASERRTEESLAAVNRTLESISARISGLNFTATPAGEALRQAAAPEAAPVEAPPAPEPRRKRELRAEPRLDEVLADAERPVAQAPAQPQDEILLEPGAARPKAIKGAADLDSADIKSSFIAAARRAAQAAAADSAAAKGREGRRAGDAAVGAAIETPTGLARRLRAMIDKRRRPLLLSAAALVLALGAVQVIGRGAAPTQVSSVEQRVASAAAPAPVAASPTPDVTTTQSISPRSAPLAPEASTVAATRPDLSVVPAQPAPATAAPFASASLSPIAPLAPMAPQGEVKSQPVDAAALPPGLKTAALAGNAVAAYDYGTRAAEGRGVAKDPQLALKLFEKAANQGLAPAQYRLGNLYEKGIGTPRDIEAAKSWYRKAAEAGNARAMHNLAVLLAEGAGGKPDYQSAVTWFNQAANHGVRDSQFNLAVLYARGLGTAQDLSKSYTWFAIAAAGGDADSARKRDDVGARLSPADLAGAKGAAERWRVTTPAAAANEVVVPAQGWPEAPTNTASAAPKKQGRDNRV